MEVKDIKHYFFARRNGVTAEVLRRAGSGFEMIFGVDVPGISALAREIGFDKELGMRLWEDRKVRESHLLAAWLLDPGTLSLEESRGAGRVGGGLRGRADAGVPGAEAPAGGASSAGSGVNGGACNAHAY